MDKEVKKIIEVAKNGTGIDMITAQLRLGKLYYELKDFDEAKAWFIKIRDKGAVGIKKIADICNDDNSTIALFGAWEIAGDYLEKLGGRV